MKFQLLIETHNEAMQTPEATAECLRKIAHELRADIPRRSNQDISRHILDINGNTCGSWTLEID